jgi:lipoate-protein ligase A
MTKARAEKIFDDLEKSYPDVIAQMDYEFTSHDFIKKLSQLQQDLYAQVLNEYSGKGQPFQTVHCVIAKRLKNNWKHLETV